LLNDFSLLILLLSDEIVLIKSYVLMIEFVCIYVHIFLEFNANISKKKLEKELKAKCNLMNYA